VIGGAPRYDSDPSGQIRRILEFACEYDVDIDLHLDVGNTPEAMHIHYVCELTEQYRRGGRVGFMAKLSTMPPDQLGVLARRLADWHSCHGSTATNLYLMGAIKITTSVAASLTPISSSHMASIARCRQTSAQSGDALRRLLADPHGEPIRRPAGRRCGTVQECFSMLTERSARLLNLKDYGLAIGNPADIVVIDAATPEEGIAEIRQPRRAASRTKSAPTGSPRSRLSASRDC
jgi:cytosine deaminase